MNRSKGATALRSMQPSSLVPAKPPTAATPAAILSREWSAEWAIVRKLALRQLKRFVSLEPKALKGDNPDAVHDMRVSSRRLQQVLDLLYPTPPKEIRRFRRKIKTARGALSDVRNYDVQLQRVEKSLARKHTVHRETWEAVRDYLLDCRSESFDKAHSKLGRANLAAAGAEFKKHLDWVTAKQVGNTEGHARLVFPPKEVTSEPFQERLRSALEKVWQGYDAAVAESRRDPGTPVLHGVRISAKRLRYLIEVLHALEVGGSAEVLRMLRRLQAHLGNWHDRELLEPMLVDMLARPKFLKDHVETAIAVEKLILRNRAAKKDYVDRYFKMTLGSAESRRLMDWAQDLLASLSVASAVQRKTSG